MYTEGMWSKTGWHYIAEGKKDKMRVYFKGHFKESGPSGFDLQQKVVIYQNKTLLTHHYSITGIRFTSITTTTCNEKTMQDNT